MLLEFFALNARDADFALKSSEKNLRKRCHKISPVIWKCMKLKEKHIHYAPITRIMSG